MASSVGLCLWHKPQHPHHVKIRPRGQRQKDRWKLFRYLKSSSPPVFWSVLPYLVPTAIQTAVIAVEQLHEQQTPFTFLQHFLPFRCLCFVVFVFPFGIPNDGTCQADWPLKASSYLLLVAKRSRTSHIVCFVVCPPPMRGLGWGGVWDRRNNPRLNFFFSGDQLVHINSTLCTPVSVHSGSASWDDCGRAFPDE